MKRKNYKGFGSLKISVIIFLSIFLLLSIKLQSQQCVDCNSSNTTNGSYSSAIGTNNHADGDFSFVAGENSKADGRSSFSLGQSSKVYDNYALGIGRYLDVYGSSSLAIGRYLKTLTPDAMVIGYGYSETQTLDNNINRSLMIGLESTKPTFFVGPSSGVNNTGRVGIGNITAPQAKLHIKADAGEPATLRLEATGTSGDNIYSRMLFTSNHSIQAADNQNFTFSTQSAKHFVFQNGNVGIGVTNPHRKLMVDGDIEFSGNLYANGQIFSGSNWTEVDGNIYRLDGKVGIGIINSFDHLLAVNGSIIATEVVIKHPSNWYDHVFEDDYKLMDLNQLEEFVMQNKHLPDIPTEKDVMAEGFQLGELSALLLKKIEELTLYTIQQHKLIEKQQELIEQLMENQ